MTEDSAIILSIYAGGAALMATIVSLIYIHSYGFSSWVEQVVDIAKVIAVVLLVAGVGVGTGFGVFALLT